MEAPRRDDGYKVGVTFVSSSDMGKDAIENALNSPKVIPIAQEAFAALKCAGINTFQIELLNPGKNEAESEVIDLGNSSLSILKKGCNDRFSKITLTARSILDQPSTSTIIDEDKLITKLSSFAEILQKELQSNKRVKREPIKPPVTYGSLVFKEGVFTAFREKIETYTNELLEKYPTLKKTKQMLDFTDYIFREHNDRALHEFQVDDLRKTLKDSKEPLMDEFLGKWIEMLYTKVNLEENWQKFLQKYVPNLKTDNCKSIVASIDEVAESLEHHSEVKGSQIYPSYDQFSLGNLPTSLWTIDHGNGRAAKFIRMANCTHVELVDRHTKKRKITIQPEFVRLLQELQTQGKRFLYINLMLTKGDCYETYSPGLKEAFQNQVGLTEAIHLLETEYGLTNIDVVTLDRNSDFYYSKGEGSSKEDPKLQEDAEYFKQACLNNLFDNESECPCIWPKRCDTVKLNGDVKEIINKVHTKYFKNAKELSDIQRNVFHDLVMKELVTYFCNGSNCDYYTIACQGSVDRGPSLSALHYWDYVIRTGQNKNPVEIMRTVVMFFVNALLMQNRLPHEQNIRTFYETLKVMEAAAEEAAALEAAAAAAKTSYQKV